MVWMILGIVLLVLVVAALALGYAMYKGLLYQLPVEPRVSQNVPDNLPTGPQYTPYAERMNADWKSFHAEPFEAVTITADDGTRLFARYYHHDDAAPVALVFHGYKGYSYRDGMGGYQILYKQGYNVLLPDQRAHGHSGGHTITLGIQERYDCLAWANYAADRFGPDKPLFLMGVSMGAATVMLATGLPLPKSVVGVIEDCGYTSPKEIAKKCITQWFHVPAEPLYTLCRFCMMLYGGVDLNAADCRTALAGTKLPVLFLHGDADDFVPLAMGREDFAACAGPKKMLVVKGAPHAMAYYYDTPTYTKTVTEFCTEVLKNTQVGKRKVGEECIS